MSLYEGGAKLGDLEDVEKDDMAIESAESVRKEGFRQGAVAVRDGVAENEVEDVRR
jgi:hypothetical protein